MQHLASIAALRPLTSATDTTPIRRDASRLLGYVDACPLVRIDAGRGYTEQAEYDRAMSALRHELGEPDLAKLTAEGAAMSEEEALETASRL
jgi:hypothetical protein